MTWGKVALTGMLAASCVTERSVEPAQRRPPTSSARPESDEVDRDALNRWVKANREPVVACYENELKRFPTLKGKVVVFFVITPAGTAGRVEIQQNSLNDAVGDCVKGIVATWVFPFKPEAEVPVAFPFVFSPLPAPGAPQL
jgi:outer membrane biosynthesis protein TonB